MGIIQKEFIIVVQIAVRVLIKDSAQSATLF